MGAVLGVVAAGGGALGGFLAGGDETLLQVESYFIEDYEALGGPPAFSPDDAESLIGGSGCGF